MNVPNEDDTDVQRLVVLRREIAEAESILLALQAAIREARSDSGLLAMTDVVAENVRLAADNLAARQEVTSAFAELEGAVRASRTDALTGLLNRLALWDIFDHDLELARRNRTLLVVYFIDIDNFKVVNDTLGHHAGDLLLQAITSILVTTVRASDTICRLGGDEFVVLTLTSAREDAALLARKLDESLRKKYLLEGHEINSSVSIGFSISPDDGITANALMRAADEAMYRVKKARKRGPDGANPSLTRVPSWY